MMYRKVLRYRGWTVKIFETEGGHDCGFPYEYRLVRGQTIIASRTSYISLKTCLINARQDVDAQTAVDQYLNPGSSRKHVVTLALRVTVKNGWLRLSHRQRPISLV